MIFKCNKENVDRIKSIIKSSKKKRFVMKNKIAYCHLINRKTRICLKFDEMLTCLAGNTYGHSIFENQVLPHIKGTEHIHISFPDHIEYCAMGFSQGFISVLGKDNFKNRCRVYGNPNFVEKFYKDVDMR